MSALSLEPTVSGRPLRIGVFGGTFDPPHIGHLFSAISVGHELQLDRVLMIVANDPWQKSGRNVTPAEARLQMVNLAIDEVHELESSRIELDRGGETYTADTLEALAVQHETASGPAELFLLVGSDAAAGLETWKRPDTIRANATIVVLERPGDGAGKRPPEGWDYDVVQLPGLEVSGSAIRARVSAGKPIDFLTPKAVVRFIEDEHLYMADPAH